MGVMAEPVLELQSVSKQFGTVVALDDVSLSVKRGSIHALLGENGAGKTTLMRIAFGMIRPDSGSIAIGGRPARISSPADAIAAGVGMVHQQFSLVSAMSVAENVALGGRGRFRPAIVASRIREIGRLTGLSLDPNAMVRDLGSAERQKLEIVRTLAHDARILILDEPTAVLTLRDIGELFAQLRAFASSGKSVILITHKLRDALRHADQVTVLRRGRVIIDAPMAEVNEETLTTAMLGTAASSTNTDGTGSATRGRAVASLVDVVADDRHRITRVPVSLEVFGGQILGVAALEGAATSILHMLAGRIVPSRGSITIPESIGFVPENRQEEAFIPDFTLTENFALRDSGRRGGLLEWVDARQKATGVIRDFDVKASGTESSLRTLSGGNQQRFLLGRELDGNPPLLILENPTQGLDVKATVEIHTRMRQAAAEGTAVVFYSSDLDELAEISHRVLVVGSSGHSFSEPDREVIGRLLLETDAPYKPNG